jgi:hypothetical protein
MTDIVGLTMERYEGLWRSEMMLDALRVNQVELWEGYEASVQLVNKWVSEEMTGDNS